MAGRSLRRLDLGVLTVWLAVGALVLLLAFDGGGYDIVVHSQVSEIAWWVVLLGAAAGVLPRVRLTWPAWTAVGLFGAFVAWTALGISWSISSERSLADLSLVAGYLGLLVLGITIHRSRRRALRHTMAALGSAIVIVAALALIARVWPSFVPTSRQTNAFFGTARLSWPLNYWNALAALMAFGIPLLLGLAGSARTLVGQAAAAAGIPVLALCGFLTLSRGGAVAAVVAVLVYLALAPERIPKLASVLVTAGGSVALMAGAAHRHDFQQGYLTATAHHQGVVMLVALVLVSVGVGLIQVAIGYAVRHGTPPRPLVVPRRTASVLTGLAVLVAVVAFLGGGGPHAISKLWRDFKRPPTAGQGQSVSRFASTSGSGRYQLWHVGVTATEHSHPVSGFGPGTYQLVWLPREIGTYDYVQNAHSLYVETFSDLGIVGIVLLGAFLLFVLGRAFLVVIRSRDESRARAAAVAAALVAFCVGAAYDWLWQVPVLPACFLLLAGALLAPRVPRRALAGLAGWGLRAAVAAVAIACLVAIGIPLATANDVRQSQAASAVGNQAAALNEALAAARVEPGASTPQVQEALVLEAEGNPSLGLVAIHRAIVNEPGNWSNWFIAARLEAETGHARVALRDFRQARALNPRSGLFVRLR